MCIHVGLTNEMSLNFSLLKFRVILQGDLAISYKENTYYARILSPRGCYPVESIYFDDAVFFQ